MVSWKDFEHTQNARDSWHDVLPEELSVSGVSLHSCRPSSEDRSDERGHLLVVLQEGSGRRGWVGQVGCLGQIGLCKGEQKRKCCDKASTLSEGVLGLDVGKETLATCLEDVFLGEEVDFGGTKESNKVVHVRVTELIFLFNEHLEELEGRSAALRQEKELEEDVGGATFSKDLDVGLDTLEEQRNTRDDK